MIFRTKHFALLVGYIAISGTVFSVHGLTQIFSEGTQMQQAHVLLATPKDTYAVIHSESGITQQERSAFIERVRTAYEQSVGSRIAVTENNNVDSDRGVVEDVRDTASPDSPVEAAAPLPDDMGTETNTSTPEISGYESTTTVPVIQEDSPVQL